MAIADARSRDNDSILTLPVTKLRVKSGSWAHSHAINLHSGFGKGPWDELSYEIAGFKLATRNVAANCENAMSAALGNAGRGTAAKLTSVPRPTGVPTQFHGTAISGGGYLLVCLPRNNNVLLLVAQGPRPEELPNMLASFQLEIP